MLREHGHRFTLYHGFFHCRFDGRTCHLDNFTETVTAFGLCSTFNLVTDDNKPWNVSSSGRSHGLELILDIRQIICLSPATLLVYRCLYIHEMSILIQESYMASPSLQDLKHRWQYLSHAKLMDPPYGQCGGRQSMIPTLFLVLQILQILQLTNQMQSMMKCPWPITRCTHQRCLDECEALYQNERCGCKADHLPGGDIRCLLKVTDQFAMIKNAVCDCPLECDQIRYNTRTSQSYFPAISYSEPLQERYYGTVFP